MSGFWSAELREKVLALRDAMVAVLEDDDVGVDEWNALRSELGITKRYIKEDERRRGEGDVARIFDAERARWEAQRSSPEYIAQQAAAEVWASVVWHQWTRASREAREAIILEELDSDGIGIKELEGRIIERLRTPELEGYRLVSISVYSHVMPLVASGRARRERRVVGKRNRWFYAKPPVPLTGPIADLEHIFHKDGE